MPTEPEQQLPRVFIGSSSESSDLASALASQLNKKGGVRATHWEDAFEHGKGTLERLAELVSRFDYAAFIVAPDDVLMSRDQEFAAVRDNVLLEAGMFIAALGRSRCFLVYPSDFSVKVPSDVLGISVPTWSSVDREEPQAALRETAFELLRNIRRDREATGRKLTSSFFFDRYEVESKLGPFYERIDNARSELIVTGNDCVAVMQSGSAAIYSALKRGVNVKIMCANPSAPGVTEMLETIDPRFVMPGHLAESVATVVKLAAAFRREFGDLFEFRLLPILPALGFFMADPNAGGVVKYEIYTPKDWSPINSRPHFTTDADPRWREYFVNMFRNYWEMARPPKDWDSRET